MSTGITTGDYNIAIGYQAGNAMTSGSYNTLFGGLAGDALTTGSYNVAIGHQALSTEDGNGRFPPTVKSPTLMLPEILGPAGFASGLGGPGVKSAL